jgi:hypothetical protein
VTLAPDWAGEQEVTLGFSEQMLQAGPEQLKGAFARMNS